jgi:TPR repeat protein
MWNRTRDSDVDTGPAAEAAAPVLPPCPDCHSDLSNIPVIAKFCPHCGTGLEGRVTAVPARNAAPFARLTDMVVGYANAMCRLGWRYEVGPAGTRNPREAARCYFKSARLGNSEARERLQAQDLTTPRH